MGWSKGLDLSWEQKADVIQHSFCGGGMWEDATAERCFVCVDTKLLKAAKYSGANIALKETL